MSRRMGGMSGPRGNNRSFSQQPFSSGVSPWQGGSGGGNMNQGGIFSQITSNPQQLALALTSLLQPQQQQPPSLLSLNTAPNFSGRELSRFGRRDYSRRVEPYNKNRQGWRGGRNDKKGGFGGPRDGKKKDDKKKDAKKEGDDKVEDGDEEKKESKRDWKDEKNNGEGKDESGDEATSKEGRYPGVPAKYLNCFVCNKQMWDGESMEKHVRGRAHSEMLKALEESIAITVNILRENMRLTEERRLIEWSRQSRLNKKQGRNFNNFESHCGMCDLKFMGKLTVHRRSYGHQRLKNYLHPSCKICNKEFPSRMEWVEHCLIGSHLKKLHENMEAKAGGAEGETVVENELEEQDLNLEPLMNETLQMENEHPILELDDNLDAMQNQLPAYKPERAVATKSLKPFNGFVCEICHRSFAEEENAQDHLKTKRHFFNFIEAVKAEHEKQLKREREEKKRKEEESKLKKEQENGEKAAEGEEGEDGDQEMYEPEEPTETQEEALLKDEDDAADGDDVPMEASQEEEQLAEEDEEEVVEEVPVKEVKKEPVSPTKPGPASKKTPVKNGAGPKSKRGRK